MCLILYFEKFVNLYIKTVLKDKQNIYFLLIFVK